MHKRVVIISPSALIAKGLEQVLRDLGEFEVAGIFQEPGEGIFRTLEPDAVVLDLGSVGVSSRAHVRARLTEMTDAALLALITGPVDGEELHQWDGVIGLLDAPSTIVRKLRGALEGRSETPRSEGEELTPREKEILVCVAKGMLNKEIADVCNLSIHTVITHRKNITRKTGIKTVAGLTVYALLNNLIDMNSVE